MEWLNYHHLQYFWAVAREGSLARASVELRLAPSTLSKQIHQLEGAFGHPLFTKRGRKLVLTDSGRVVYQYAEAIFGLGRELLDTMSGRPVGKPLRVTVGVADVVPKLVAERVLAPALQLAGPVRLVCREGKPERLLASLALHELDVILTDAPANPSSTVRAYSHLLGATRLAFFGNRELAAKYRAGFPRSLHQAPLLLPTENTVMRRTLDQWFEAQEIQPTIVGEFEDSALLSVFGQRGLGLFPAASIIAKEVKSDYHVRLVGEVPDVREQLYAVTVERRIKHPVVAVICDAAKALGLGQE